MIALVAGRVARFCSSAPFLTGWTFVVVLAIGGFFLQSTLPVNVTFGQSLAPVSAATVSSLMMGFAWGTGGLSVPFVGMIADRVRHRAHARRAGAHAAVRGGVCAAAAGAHRVSRGCRSPPS